MKTTNKAKISTIYESVIYALPYLFVCTCQHQTLFGPLQPGTHSQTDAFSGLQLIFIAKNFLQTKIINRTSIYDPICVMFFLGLINILGEGVNINTWTKPIPKLYKTRIQDRDKCTRYKI